MTKINSNHLIIIAAAILMQWHSIQFWVNQVGLAGVGWSLMLESVVIWYWWKNRVMLALIASMLLLFGPIYEITKPSLENIKHQDQVKRLNQMDFDEITRLEYSLKTYEKNSEKRIGWSGRIDRIQKLINKNSNRIRARDSENSKFELLIASGIALAQMLALLIIMTAQALAISDHRKKTNKEIISNMKSKCKLENSKNFDNEFRSEIKKTKKTRSRNVLKKPLLHAASDEEITGIEAIKKIPIVLKITLGNQGITQAQWCEKNSVSTKNLSLSKNHLHRISQNKEVAPATEIRRICEKLGLITNDIGDKYV